MNARAQGELALGLLGVWAMIQAISALASGVSMLLSWNGALPASPLLWAINIPSALMLAAGYVMVRYNTAVMAFLFPRVSATAEVEVDSLELSVVLVGCLGVWILSAAVPALVRALLMYSPDMPLGSSMGRATRQRTAAGYVVQAALGAFLAFRPRRVLALWRL